MNKAMLEVVAAAMIQDGQVLCAQRSDTMTLPLLWEFPGGKIEAGETHQEALIREIQEELNVTIQVHDFIDRSKYTYDFGTVALNVYLAEIVSGQIEVSEHKQIKWLKPDDLTELNWAPVDIPAVQKIQKMALQ